MAGGAGSAAGNLLVGPTLPASVKVRWPPERTIGAPTLRYTINAPRHWTMEAQGAEMRKLAERPQAVRLEQGEPLYMAMDGSSKRCPLGRRGGWG